MTLVWKLISDVWDLAESSRPKRRKDRSSVIKNIQKPLYDFSILKVRTVCISTFASFCDIFRSRVTDLSQADFVKSAAYLIHHWRWLTNWAIVQSWDARNHKIPVNVLKNCWYAAIFESHADNPKFQTSETVSRFELNSSVKQLSRGASLLENQKIN